MRFSPSGQCVPWALVDGIYVLNLGQCPLEVFQDVGGQPPRCAKRNTLVRDFDDSIICVLEFRIETTFVV